MRYTFPLSVIPKWAFDLLRIRPSQDISRWKIFIEVFRAFHFVTKFRRGIHSHGEISNDFFPFCAIKATFLTRPARCSDVRRVSGLMRSDTDVINSIMVGTVQGGGREALVTFI